MLGLLMMGMMWPDRLPEQSHRGGGMSPVHTVSLTICKRLGTANLRFQCAYVLELFPPFANLSASAKSRPQYRSVISKKAAGISYHLQGSGCFAE